MQSDTVRYISPCLPQGVHCCNVCRSVSPHRALVSLSSDPGPHSNDMTADDPTATEPSWGLF